MNHRKPKIGITMGDPASIGPEIVVKALSKPEIYRTCRPLVVGDASVIREALKITGVISEIHVIENVKSARFIHGIIDVFDLKNVDMARLQLGEISPMAGHAAFEAIKKAIELAMRNEIDANVTGPIHKEAINKAGHHFAGHTEIYAHFTGTSDVGMLLVSDNLCVIHVSTHVSLREACDLVKKDRIVKVIQMLDDACRQVGIDSPKIGVAGLNPHSSDGGLFGGEEQQEIIPAIKEARTMGFDVQGPIPPDTLFSIAKGGFYDGCVAMYHDQGHIPFKLVGFSWNNEKGQMESVKGVNVTLGLPIIRTSVDHGTAFEIAGKGIASPEALIHAIDFAVRMAQNRIRKR